MSGIDITAPGFMRLADRAGHDELEQRAVRRRHGACCIDCGRPAFVVALTTQEARMRCRCGWSGEARRGSKGYKAAKARAESGA